MDEGLDAHGQPLERGYNWNRLKDSRTDELIGICRGIMADGVLVLEEARFVLEWLKRNPPVRTSPMGRNLESGLNRALADNDLSHEDEEQLVDLIFRIIGGTPTLPIAASYTTSFPLDDPPPSIVFPSRVFCFTGKFKFGPRKCCEEAVVRLDGLIHGHPTRQTSFLVLGELGSRDWAHSAMGRKIEYAAKLRDGGCCLSIVCEQHWCAALRACGCGEAQ
jgi:hypothetical protein